MFSTKLVLEAVQTSLQYCTVFNLGKLCFTARFCCGSFGSKACVGLYGQPGGFCTRLFCRHPLFNCSSTKSRKASDQ